MAISPSSVIVHHVDMHPPSPHNESRPQDRQCWWRWMTLFFQKKYHHSRLIHRDSIQPIFHPETFSSDWGWHEWIHQTHCAPESIIPISSDPSLKVQPAHNLTMSPPKKERPLTAVNTSRSGTVSLSPSLIGVGHKNIYICGCGTQTHKIDFVSDPTIIVIGPALIGFWSLIFWGIGSIIRPFVIFSHSYRRLHTYSLQAKSNGNDNTVLFRIL